MQKKVYSFDRDDGLYKATITLDASDIDPLDGGWLIPGDCLEYEPPVTPPGKRVRAINRQWVIEDIPEVYEPEPEPVVEPTPAVIEPAAHFGAPPPELHAKIATLEEQLATLAAQVAALTK